MTMKWDLINDQASAQGCVQWTSKSGRGWCLPRSEGACPGFRKPLPQDQVVAAVRGRKRTQVVPIPQLCLADHSDCALWSGPPS
jgi:hypothetical protein